MRGQAGQPSETVKVYDLDTRRTIDSELIEHSLTFMQRHAAAKKPFFLYLPLTHLHFPTLPHTDFAGRSGNGDFADSMLEMDHRVGQIEDEVERLGLTQDTLFIFCSDNGPEFRAPYRGTAGPWRGTYHTAMEGSLRVPFIARWPGKIAAGRVNNEVVHVTDLFTTLITLVQGQVPIDRAIDGCNQLPFLLDGARSAREGFLFYLKGDLRSIKWRDWKMHYYWMPEVNEGQGKLESPYMFNLTRDPKEESNVAVHNTWVLGPMLKMVQAFNESVKRWPNTPPGKSD